MPLDPILQMIVDNTASSGRDTSLASGTVEEARAGYDAMGAVGGQAPDLADVADRVIPGPAGDIPVRVYTPVGEGPHPVVAFFHGGGFVIGSFTSHDPLCRQLAANVPALVVAVDYRLAPEAKFPAAYEDSWTALQWIAEHAKELGGDPARLAVAGDSAGGNLAAVTALAAKANNGPAIALQVLMYPTLDATMGHPSIEENAAGPLLTKDTMAWFFGHYMGGVDADLRDPRVSPIFADDVSGVAPALVITAEFDPLRDEGEAYGAKLAAAGVPTTVHRYDGMAHAFIQLAGVLPGGKQAIDEVVEALKAALA